jgi:hypothetical protein
MQVSTIQSLLPTNDEKSARIACVALNIFLQENFIPSAWNIQHLSFANNI